MILSDSTNYGRHVKFLMGVALPYDVSMGSRQEVVRWWAIGQAAGGKVGRWAGGRQEANRRWAGSGQVVGR